MTDLQNKIAVLRTVGIFAAVEGAALVPIAQALEPLSFPANTRIFESGDTGDALYIVAEGRVRVHDGDMLINYLEPGSVFGEMAVLDSSPRSASVSAEVDSRLFRLGQQHLYSLMQSEMAVTRGIIQNLCQHLRNRVRDMARDFEYLRQFNKVTAAARALEEGRYAPESIAEVAQRSDELGQLARVFQRMAHEVAQREQRLRQEVQALRIEIDRTRQQRQVDEITGTEYFRSLRQKADELRNAADEQE